MEQMFRGLTVGLALAMVVIVLLLTAYFQSLGLAVISASAIPAVIAGVAGALALTGTTLNLQSFMGTIMAIGVATANAILLLTFAERGRAGCPRSGGGRGRPSRLRPMLMTSLAMLAGHGPHGPGPWGGRRADGAPGTGGYRWSGSGNAGYAHHPSLCLCNGSGPGRHRLYFVAPR